MLNIRFWLVCVNPSRLSGASSASGSTRRPPLSAQEEGSKSRWPSRHGTKRRSSRPGIMARFVASSTSPVAFDQQPSGWKSSAIARSRPVRELELPSPGFWSQPFESVRLLASGSIVRRTRSRSASAGRRTGTKTPSSKDASTFNAMNNLVGKLPSREICSECDELNAFDEQRGANFIYRPRSRLNPDVSA
jgi:hypothetical protein